MRENYVCPHTHDANQFRMATLDWEGIGRSCEKDCGAHWKKGKQVCSANNPGWLCKVQACKIARCNNCYGAEFCSRRTRRAGGGRQSNGVTLHLFSDLVLMLTWTEWRAVQPPCVSDRHSAFFLPPDSCEPLNGWT